jgi:hypothetical protein
MATHSLFDRHRTVLVMMKRTGVGRLVCCGNGHHQIDLENPVADMTGSRQIAPPAADLVTRLFKDARPTDLPFEQPTRYPFVVNFKTAKATGIELPVNLVALADEVIE